MVLRDQVPVLGLRGGRSAEAEREVSTNITDATWPPAHFALVAADRFRGGLHPDDRAHQVEAAPRAVPLGAQ